jgi:hypothetical protein
MTDRPQLGQRLPRSRRTEAAIKRAISAALSCGLQVTGYVVGKDGSIQVTTAPAPAQKALAESPAPAAVLTPRQWARR